jgi:hypothetical protein
MSNSSAGPSAQLPTVRWALRRTALGLAILFIVVAASAWLLHASIDPDEASAGAAAAVEQDAEQK